MSANPPAFPSGQFTGCEPTRGLTLRDWFAGQVVEQCIRNAMDADGGWDADNVAYHAYLVADAMLAERQRTEGENSTNQAETP